MRNETLRQSSFAIASQLYGTVMGHANVLVSISQEDEMRWKYHHNAHFYKGDGEVPHFLNEEIRAASQIQRSSPPRDSGCFSHFPLQSLPSLSQL
jgi:hypothetical protein